MSWKIELVPHDDCILRTVVSAREIFGIATVAVAAVPAATALPFKKRRRDTLLDSVFFDIPVVPPIADYPAFCSYDSTIASLATVHAHLRQSDASTYYSRSIFWRKPTLGLTQVEYVGFVPAKTADLVSTQQHKAFSQKWNYRLRGEYGFSARCVSLVT